jgi:periplasmic copper chaperone A
MSTPRLRSRLTRARRLTRTRRLTLAGTAATLAAALALIPLTTAEAHVSVHPDVTTAGAESAEITFRVPTESAKASTVAVQLNLPTASPLPEVLARPIAGWTVKVVNGKLPKPVVVEGTTLTEAPATVTWTATSNASGIKPGQYQDFSISAGPLPKSGDVTFTAKQTYSDGTVVLWNQPQPPGAGEPEHPAPSFSITPAVAADGSSAAPASAPAPSSQPGSTGTSTSSSDPAARWMAAGALALGVVALLVAGLGRRTPRAAKAT